MPFLRNVNDVAKSIATQQANLLQKNVSNIKKEGYTQIKRAYYFFPKPPIDTGESRKQSKLEIQRTGETDFSFLYVVGTSYSKFFLEGIGNNRKYGKRDVRQKANEIMIQEIIPKYFR